MLNYYSAMRYVALMFLGVLFACQSQPGQETTTVEDTASLQQQPQPTQEVLFDEMMAIHDSVMPEMDHIYQLRQKIRAELDSLQAASSTESARLDRLEQAYLNLADADEAMMNWMRSNDFTFEGMTEEEIITRIEQETQSIQQVSDQIQASIQEAEQLLEE
ncbi:MAG: hypothetical protein RIG62_10340 [Cyclobacteriaceae bacterium]